MKQLFSILCFAFLMLASGCVAPSSTVTLTPAPTPTIIPGSSTITTPWKWPNNGLPSADLKAATDTTKTPEQIASFLLNNVIWQDDYDISEFMSPNDTLIEKRTVCTGFARYWVHSLAMNGHTSHFVAAWSPSGAHAFVVFQYQGEWRLASNQYYYGNKTMGKVGQDYLETAAINGAIEFYGASWKTVQVFNESGKVVQTITNQNAPDTAIPASAPSRNIFTIRR